MTVDLFITCLNDALFPKTGRATVKLLERLGHTVQFDQRQTCCGQMHFNTGYQEDALKLIRRFVEIFQSKEVVVSPSGSCVAMVRHLYPKAAEWAGDNDLKKQTEELAAKTFELSEFLVKKLNVEDVGAYYPHRVTYHPTCHSSRVIHVGDAPLKLLKKVKGLELVELPEKEQCCGFGGTFSVKNPDTSAAMMDDKIKCILQTGADCCTAGDNSCLMHIGGGLSRQGQKTQVIHLAEILANTEQVPFE